MRLSILFLVLTLAACNLSGSPDPQVEATLDAPTTEAQSVEASATAQEITRTAFPTQLPISTAVLPPTAILPPTSTPASGLSAPLAAPSLIAIASGEQVYTLNLGSGVTGRGLNVLRVTAAQFDQNPANRNRYVVVDTTGLVYVTDAAGANAFRVEQGPYTQFAPASRQENNAAADLAVWSPDGQYIAFIINADQEASDGVWYFRPGEFAPIQMIVDCPAEGARSCMIVRAPDNIRFWESREVYWSPDSQTLLVNAFLPGDNRRGLMVRTVTRDERIRDERPRILRYDYGTWGSDGRILASGRNPDGVVLVTWVNSDGTPGAQVYAAGANGLWMGWAVQAPGGAILALGRPGNPDGPVGIYAMDGTLLTPPIGDAFPSRVVWSHDRRAVLVEAGGRQFIASADGQVIDITGQTGGRPVNWVR